MAPQNPPFKAAPHGTVVFLWRQNKRLRSYVILSGDFLKLFGGQPTDENRVLALLYREQAHWVIHFENRIHNFYLAFSYFYLRLPKVRRLG